MEKVYILWGSVGEYSDYSEWRVAVYATLEQAIVHKDLAQQYVNSRPKYNYKDATISLAEQGVIVNYYAEKNPYDPNKPTRSGVEYHVEEVPYVRHVDEFQDFAVKYEDYISH